MSPIRSVRAHALSGVVAMVLAVAQPAVAQENVQRLDTVQVSVAAHTSSSVVGLTRSVQVITRDDIERSGAGTIPELLARSQSVDLLVSSPALADISIRGTSLGQVLVLVDGVRMTDRQTAHFDLNLAVPLDQVERIEIMRGAGSAQYGADAVGGVINVVTKDRAATAVRAQAGSYGTRGLAVTIPWIAAEYERSNGHRARPDPSGGGWTGTDYRIGQVRAEIGSQALGFSAANAVRDFGANRFYAANFDSHERTATTTAEGHAEQPLGDRLNVAAQISGRRHADQYTLRRTNPGSFRNRHVSTQTGLTVAGRYKATPAAEFALGGDLQDAQLKSVAQDATPGRIALGSRRDQTAAAFLQGTFRNGFHASADVGVRSDWTDGFGTFLSPTIAGSWQASQTVVLRASASSAFRAPSWFERFYADPGNVGNPALKAERFVVGEVGARAYPGWGGRVDVAVWGRNATNVIDWIRPVCTPPSCARFTATNIAEIEYRGVEGEVTLPAFGSLEVTTLASFLAFDATATGYAGKYALRPIISSLGARATVDLGRFGLSADARNVLRATEARAYVIGNASLRARIIGGAELGVSVENFGRASYLDNNGLPVAGPWLTSTLTWR